MPESKTAKIYKIYSDNCDKVYVGATGRESLSQRLSEHRSRSRKVDYRCKSAEVIRSGDAKIALLEKCSYNNKGELHERELYYIKLLNVVNKNLPCPTMEERKERNRIINTTRVECECGSVIAKSYRKRHQETKKHMKWIANNKR